MQYKLNKLDAEARRVGLKIIVEKTKMMRINPRSQEQFTIGTQDRIEEVEEFSYLGATVCKDGERPEQPFVKSERGIYKTEEDLEIQQYIKEN
jgi:hypothetical protein